MMDEEPDRTPAGRRTAGRWLALALLFAAALGVRLYGLGQLPLDFHPTRQYRSALIARSLYYGSAPQDAAAPWQRQVAAENAAQEGQLEPALMERAAALAYRLTGAERLWIPRLLSSLFWLAGGVLLYRIATLWNTRVAAFVSTAVYLFLSFGISASRSFQPDPPMVLLLLASVLALVRQRTRTSAGSWSGAALLCGLAALLKPIALFPAFGAAVALELRQRGARRHPVTPRLLIFSAVALAPSVLYYAYGWWTVGSLRDQARGSILPELMAQPTFWRGWLMQIVEVTGLVLFVAGLAGVLLAPSGWRRNLIAGLWIGYFATGCVFTYHIHTHDYYQLQLIPIVALGLAPVTATLLGSLDRTRRLWAAFLLLGSGLAHVGLHLDRVHDLPDTRVEADMAREIGEAVGHSTRTLLLAPHYGKPLKFHGELGGDVWPDRRDRRADVLLGGADPDAASRLRGLREASPRDYFIVTDLGELAAQQDLLALLEEHPVLVRTERYVVFDLRQGAEASRRKR